jgi:hypothetical protein
MLQIKWMKNEFNELMWMSKDSSFKDQEYRGDFYSKFLYEKKPKLNIFIWEINCQITFVQINC